MDGTGKKCIMIKRFKGIECEIKRRRKNEKDSSHGVMYTSCS